MTQNLEDVARRAGVSTATASRALRGLTSVKPETLARVQAIAEEMGYVASPAASRLASGRTRTIGLLTPWVNRWFFANVIEGAQKRLHADGFDALLFSFHETPTHPRMAVDPAALRRRVDGVLVLGMQLTDHEVRDLETLGVPIVFAGPGHRDHATVGVDDHAIGRMAVEHLWDMGHRNIGHLAGADWDQFPLSPSLGRFQGWREALGKRGIHAPANWMTPTSFTWEAAHRAAHALLDEAPELTALFAATDTVALGAMHAARERGFVVGRDFAIVGVDDEEISAHLGLTTIRQSPEQQGKAAAELLLRALAGEELPMTTLGKISLVERPSTGPFAGTTDN
ncbi:LacI family DNA-binding transcriptional regulator [Timonella senegalensis]|uniref:LacI family DNA-binding transcriptional regulator n=1 Tax=Timonella senegalensis TaxID=1465825 RepID=UPI000317CD40|nr:LacI family DNA-binding transcriptional regulator [Timonella senegalensis]